MKKLIALLLVLTLGAGLFAGCGKQDFACSLTPLDADLEFAPNVIIEPDEPPYNLGGWMEEDDVWWYADIPADGTYMLRAWYSMPGEYEDNVGCFSFLFEEEDSFYDTVLFHPTSAPGSWDEYDYIEFAVDLPKGPLTLSLMPYELGDQQDYFINLRQIDLYTGEAPEGPGEPDWEPVPEYESSDASGWWVRPEGYESEGLSLIDCFFVDGEQWFQYNEFGDVIDSGSCTAGDGRILLSTDFSDAEFILSGNSMLSIQDGNTEFVRVEDPGFIGQDMNFDGTWYLNGDVDGESWYWIQGDTYEKHLLTSDGSVEEESGTFTRNLVTQIINDRTFEDVLKLRSDVTFGPDFIFPNGQSFFYEDDGFDFKIYIHEDYVVPSMKEAYARLTDLMNMDLHGHVDDETMLSLTFWPYCFTIDEYRSDGDAGYSATGESLCGQWALLDEETLYLCFDDGTEEYLFMPEPDGSLYIDTVGVEFPMDPFFF